MKTQRRQYESQYRVRARCPGAFQLRVRGIVVTVVRLKMRRALARRAHPRSVVEQPVVLQSGQLFAVAADAHEELGRGEWGIRTVSM